MSSAVHARRRAPRALPRTHENVTVVLRNPEGRTIGRGFLCDLSVLGAGVLMPVRLAKRVTAQQDVVATLGLDADAPPLELPGRVRYTFLADAPGDEGHTPQVLHLGIEFSPEAREQPAAQAALTTWVDGRLHPDAGPEVEGAATAGLLLR